MTDKELLEMADESVEKHKEWHLPRKGIHEKCAICDPKPSQQSVNDWEKVDLDKVIIIKGEMRTEDAQILSREEEKVVFLLPEGCELLDTEPVKALVNQARTLALQEAMEVVMSVSVMKNDKHLGFLLRRDSILSALTSLAKE